MNIKRKAMSILMIAAMIMSLAVPVLAKDSPVNPPKPVNPGYDPATYTDYNQQDHANKTVTTEFKTGKSVTVKVEAIAGKTNAQNVIFYTARNRKNNKVAITYLGNGTNGIFDSSKGRVVTLAQIPAAKVTIRANAFKGSKIDRIQLKGQKVSIAKNAFNGTKVANPTIVVGGTKRLASDFTVKTGSFNGLNSSAKIVVSKKSMTKAQFDLFKSKVVKAGFKGKVLWK